MIPTVHLASHDVSSYLLMLAIALTAATAVAVVLAPRLCITREKAFWLSLISITLGYAGSKIQSILFETGLSSWIAKPGSLTKGLAIQGGLVLGGLALLASARVLRVRVSDAFDLAAPAAALGIAIGRIGCLLSGCCWGKPTLFSIALVFSDFDAPVRPIGVPLHATQVYSAVAALLIFGYLVLYRLPRRRFGWQVLCELVLLYGVCRFGIEILRADPRGPVVAGLSTPQVIAVTSVLIAGLAYVLLHAGMPRGSRGSLAAGSG